MPAQPTADRTVPGAQQRARAIGVSGVRAALLRWQTQLALTAILLLGAALRLVGFNWGRNLYLHPDERFMTMVADAIDWPGSVGAYFQSDTSPLNPYNNDFGSFVYGTFPLFLTKAVGDLSGQNVYGSLHLAGRAVSTVADLLTVLCVFLVGRTLFNAGTGLVGALLMSLTVLHIQASHFFTVDAVAAAGCIAAFALALKATERGRWWTHLAAGVVVGLAVASKVSVLPIAAVLTLPALEAWRLSGWRAMFSGRHGAGARRLPPVLGVALAVLGAVWTFRLAQPYAFDPGWLTFSLDQRWVEDLRYWREVQAGRLDVPPNHQWADRTPLLFSLRNLLLWGMGPPLGVTALVALVAGAITLLRSPRCPSFPLLFLVGWPAFHLLYFGTAFVKAMRYLLPAYPFLVVLAAALLVHLWGRAAVPGTLAGRRLPPGRWRWQWLWRAPAVLVVVLTLLYAAAFTRIYTAPSTRIAASEWIYANAPEAAGIASEHWDDAIPVPLPGYDHARYAGVQLELYHADTPEKLDQMVATLDGVTYLVVTSNRLSGSIPRLPERYPMTTAYYEMLFAGELGFELAAEFTSYPRLAGITLNDDTAEESFTVYDHPKVLIFRKTSMYTVVRQEFTERLEGALAGGAVPILPAQAGKGLLLLDEATRAEQEASGTWSRLFDEDGLANRWPVPVWYFAWQLLALAAVPLCWRVCRALPDRGYALSKTLGPLLAVYVAWLLPSLRLVPFGPDVVGLGVVAVVALSLAVVWRQRRAFLGDLRTRWRWLLAAELLFAAAFLAFVWVRAQNPDLWHPARGGEKPMELAYLNAVVRSVWFPPYDPWFAGGAINYYYFGYVVVAAVIRLTGILPAVAFNLAVPTVFALTVVNAWAVTAALLSARRWRSPWAPLLAALSGPLFVVVLGNLDLAMRIGRGEWGELPTGIPRLLADAGGPAVILAGIWAAVTGRVALPPDGYWPSTRVIEGTINEFPAFTFLFADLHPHLLALPVTLAALLVALTWFLRPAGETSPPDEPIRPPPRDTGASRRFLPWRRFPPLDAETLGLVGLAGLLAGTLLVTNSWDYPTYLLVLVGAFAYGTLRGAGWRLSFPLLCRVGLGTGAIVVLSRVLFWPYLRRYEGLAVDLVPAGGRTQLDEYLVIFGVFLFLAATLLAGEWLADRAPVARFRWLWPAGVAWRVRPVEGGRRSVHGQLLLAERPVAVGRTAAVAGLGAGVALLLLTGALRGLLLGLLALALGVAWRRRVDPAVAFIAALVALAAAISLIVDVVAVGGNAGRMNTVFKFYLQVWTLLGIAAAAGMVLVLARFGGGWRVRPAVGWVWSGVAALLVAGALVYPALATPARLADRFNPLPPTLDGMAFMETAVRDEAPENRPATSFPLAGDRDAMLWLLRNVQGSPVVLEAAIPDYRWGSRVSAFTGLPTVLGWDYHETQQRAGYPTLLDERRLDVGRIYGEPGDFAAIQPLLDKYHVRYIYVGDLEYAYFSGAALVKFEVAAAQGLIQEVYRAGGVTIFRYDGPAG